MAVQFLARLGSARLGSASLGADLVVVTPCLIVPSWRRKILQSDVDIEDVGLITLTVLIVAVACYNYFGAGNGI